MKVYVVISAEGLYDSDVKTVEGVYTSQELAEHAAKLYGGAEVREILADMIPKHPEGCYPYEVDLNPGGEVFWVERVNIKEFEDGRFRVINRYDSKINLIKSGLFQVFAKDEEHAIHIARERSAERIASGELPLGWADKPPAPVNQGSK